MDIGPHNSKLRAEPRIVSEIQGSNLPMRWIDAYVYVNARELCGSAVQLGLFFVRRTISWS